MKNNPYQTSKKIPTQEASSGLMVAATLAFFVNSAVAYILFLYVMNGSLITCLVFLFVQALLIPALVVGLFQLFKNFRNTKSRIKIFLFTSILIIVSILLIVGIFLMSL